jgi:LysM repeat protein
MVEKDSPQEVIDTYKKRQKMLPFLIGGLAVLLVVVGVIIIVAWLAGPNNPGLSFRASETPTVTITVTNTPVTPTSTATLVPTETVTATITVTETPSGPFEYTIQEGDTCWDLAVRFNVDIGTLLAINNFPAGGCPIQPGQNIFIPAPGQELPTRTPIPTGLPYGTVIEHTVQYNETLAEIASRYSSTVESIMEVNKLEDANTIFVGQVLKVKVNIATPTPTYAPTSETPVTTIPTIQVATPTP